MLAVVFVPWILTTMVSKARGLTTLLRFLVGAKSAERLVGNSMPYYDVKLTSWCRFMNPKTKTLRAEHVANNSLSVWVFHAVGYVGSCIFSYTLCRPCGAIVHVGLPPFFRYTQLDE